MDLNFVQKSFIDYMFELNSIAFYGDKNLSFSAIINNIKQTNNYYVGILNVQRCKYFLFSL